MQRGQPRLTLVHTDQDGRPTVPIGVETHPCGICDGQRNPAPFDVCLSGRFGERQRGGKTLVRRLAGAGHDRGIDVSVREHVESRSKYGSTQPGLMTSYEAVMFTKNDYAYGVRERRAGRSSRSLDPVGRTLGRVDHVEDSRSGILAHYRYGDAHDVACPTGPGRLRQS